MRLLTWNLFHGRDHPPDPALFTRRSLWLRAEERNETHVQVNRPLRAEFAQRLATEAWDVALLQEAPPRWHRALREATDAAGGAVALTSRNCLGAARRALADLNPDLIGSDEGGSNQLLVRAPWRVAQVRTLTLARRPERRRLLWARLESDHGSRPVCVGTIHLSTGPPEKVEAEALVAARAAVRWSDGHPLVLGGDFNIRPRRSPAAFERLQNELGLAPPTGPNHIDHLLVRGAELEEGPRALPVTWREVPAAGGRSLRLSDHTAIVARIAAR